MDTNSQLNMVGQQQILPFSWLLPLRGLFPVALLHMAVSIMFSRHALRQHTCDLCVGWFKRVEQEDYFDNETTSTRCCFDRRLKIDYKVLENCIVQSVIILVI